MELKKLVGRRVVVLGPKLLDQAHLETVTLLGIDNAGIWIESEAAANRVADRFRLKPAGRSAFFIPFTQITTIIASNDEAAAGPEAAAA